MGNGGSFLSIPFKTEDLVDAVSRQYDSEDENDDQSRFDPTTYYKTKKGSEIPKFHPFISTMPDKNESEEEGVDMRKLKRFLILGADTVYKAINEPERQNAKSNKKTERRKAQRKRKSKEENAKSNKEPIEENDKSNKEPIEEIAKSNKEPIEENAKSNKEPIEEIAKSNKEPIEENAKSNKEPIEENAKSNKDPKEENAKCYIEPQDEINTCNNEPKEENAKSKKELRREKAERNKKLKRENSTWYNEPRRENAECIDRLIVEGKGKEVVELITNISLAGRAPKQIPTMYALAICARSNDADTKKAAYDALNVICRIPTHLFSFVKYCKTMNSCSGWSRVHRRGLNGWYTNKAMSPMCLGRLVTKYKRRGGWKHKDLFNLTHIKPDSDGLNVIVKYLMKGLKAARKLVDEEMAENDGVKELMVYLEGADKARTCTDEDEMVKLIKIHGLEREHISTQLLRSKKVWESLLENIKMTAVIKNLGRMTELGLINDDSDVEHCIVAKVTDEKVLKQARVHPFNVLLTLKTYSNGKGKKGKLTWTPNKNVVKALNQAYYKSFDAVEPSNKRYLLAIDVSEFMDVPCVGSNSISCRDAAAAMMMTTSLTEQNCDIVAYSDKLTPFSIDKSDTIDQVVDKCLCFPDGPTDCALPMIWAQEKKKTYDVFIVYTASKVMYGIVHPSKALKDYRDNTKNQDSKLIVVGMASDGFSIADPDDNRMLDIIGFDSGATQIIAEFSCGKV